ncbi:MAG TPA: PQQ-dependent sugar dehydrogenase [Gaiellaceae bacterium]|nr:PQQ-dependent sugar dehydrogenase [Gaiellaceae bacterium]
MRRPRALATLVALLALALAVPGTAAAVRLQFVAGGFDQLTQVAAPRSGDPAGTLYVVEQEGQVYRLRGGTRRLLLDIRSLVGCCGEQGLLGIAFDPRWGSNDLFYVNYTNVNGDTRIARYRANAAHTRVVRGTRRQLLSLDQPAGNHNGGRLAFARNGRLYAGQGDGGGSCDPGGRAQNLRSRHGKLLSLNPRRIRAGWRIDAYGLRNPWGFSFDRANGRLYIGDVGQETWEEVDTLVASRLGGIPENFMWDAYEGRARSGCSTGGLRGPGARVRPISVYSHSLGCSITGGYVYRGRSMPGFRGFYHFGDFCSGRIWRLKYANGRVVRGRTLVLDTNLRITSFGEGVGGELFLTHQAGQVYKLVRS